MTDTNVEISSDVNEAWNEAKEWAPALRSFVANGGRYLGFCLGGCLAGHDPGFNLLAPDDNAMQEIEEPGSQVQDKDDTIIQVEWEFLTGPKKGEKEMRWMYFQDGVAITQGKESPAVVLGRYSSTGDVAAMLNPFERGGSDAWGLIQRRMRAGTVMKRSRTLTEYISISAMTL